MAQKAQKAEAKIISLFCFLFLFFAFLLCCGFCGERKSRPRLWAVDGFGELLGLASETY
jgi:hypothetical protein